RRGDPRVPAQPVDVHRQRRHGRGGRLVAAARRRPDRARRRRRPQPVPSRHRLNGGCKPRDPPPRGGTRPLRVLAAANDADGATEDHMNLQPLDDRIVVKPGESEETTASGLVIPDTAKEKPQQGEVLAVGPGRRSEHSGELVPMDVKTGDSVIYSKYGGTEGTGDGEDLLILNPRDVLAGMTKK